jgi:hypothetical protein
VLKGSFLISSVTMVFIIPFITELINIFTLKKVVCYCLLYKLFVCSYLFVIPSVRKLLVIRFVLILSCVRGSMTNNIGSGLVDWIY